MTSRDRAILLITLLLITAIIAFDLVTDSGEGVALWHLLAEGAAGLLGLGGVFYVLQDMFRLKKHLHHEREISAGLKQESEEWRNRSKTYLDGLSEAIDQQLTAWHLTPAEREVAFLLLKGMSLKEIAEIRDTAEKTARVQSMSIYAKAGLSGRSELAAFFLEDLLPATGMSGNKDAEQSPSA
ncbi:MAG: LuxR family transcriptional regulator [Porticoccus sp.]|jgi:DNA-binding CsgD family transcriptional regulator|uniref:helix-turn-helix transcriptional regulator n=1 Tax=Porticoccus hydrocarbonoclasticus TaxID=1073414 RepID=UPI00068FE33E|nr:helix-turn-helix transcriptional regulator [Porticoccus hydrocarbonoclasticus]MBG58363.1 LuxR family transcriptional regulator [Porticoccus sp.]|tara:strand:- start:4597 stop:5145 length:549 start_codon:yes stop_codon:yes gene_type:complete